MEITMRKVTFYIDDIEYFRKRYKDKMTEQQFNELFSDMANFKVIYSLFGEGENIERYELTDYAGNTVNLNSLNGYQKGIILNDCKAYFEGKAYFNENDDPCGIVKIEESEI